MELLPWAGRLTSSDQSRALDAIVTIWELDPGLGTAATQYPWLRDEVDYSEASVLALLAAIAGSDLELAWQVSAWVAGGAGRAEADVLSGVAVLANFDSQLARQVLHRLASRVRDLDRYFGQSLTLLADSYPEDFGRLTRQPWFADGMEDEEMALIVPLSIIYTESGSSVTRDLFNGLIDSHFTQSKMVSLPLAGDVNIWVFQSTPFPANEDLSAIIEHTIRLSEGFLKTPFPTTDVILLTGTSVESRNLNSYMRVRRTPGGVGYIPHETAHYYFGIGPQWYVEGGANFIESYVRDRTGVESLNDRRLGVSRWVRERCKDFFGLGNLQDLNDFTQGQGWPHGCHYQWGELFLTELFEILGEEATGRALGEIHALYEARGHSPSEEDIYDVLLANTPANLEETVKDLYRRVHGGPFTGPAQDPG